jgi:hypothetical protein
MKQAQSALLLLLGTALAVSSAQASTTNQQRHSGEADSSTQSSNRGARKDVDVSVPHASLTPDQGTEIYSTYEEPAFIAPRNGDSARLEVSASSWVPGSLTAPSHLADTSSFTGSGIPEAQLTFFTSPVGRWKRVSLSIMGGLGFGVLHRTGTYVGDDATPSQTLQENGYVVPATLGAEARMEIRGPWSAYGDLALMPVAAFTTHTVFVQESGGSVWGIPLQAALGISNDLYWLSSSLKGVQIKAGAVATVNTFGSSDFSGLGAVGGVSLPL